MEFDWNTNLSSHATTNKVVPLQDYREFRSNAISMDWKDRIYDQLKAFGADPQEDCEFNAVSGLRAEQLIRDLPTDIDSPTLSLEDQGNILIEWYKKPRGEEATIFSVVLGTENYIYSLLKNGVPDTHGALNYSQGSLEVVLSLLRKNFGITLNARLKA